MYNSEKITNKPEKAVIPTIFSFPFPLVRGTLCLLWHYSIIWVMWLKIREFIGRACYQKEA